VSVRSRDRWIQKFLVVRSCPLCRAGGSCHAGATNDRGVDRGGPVQLSLAVAKRLHLLKHPCLGLVVRPTAAVLVERVSVSEPIRQIASGRPVRNLHAVASTPVRRCTGGRPVIFTGGSDVASTTQASFEVTSRVTNSTPVALAVRPRAYCTKMVGQWAMPGTQRHRSPGDVENGGRRRVSPDAVLADSRQR